MTGSCELNLFRSFSALMTARRNPGGVRFGSAEIYEVVEMCFSPSAATSKAHMIVDCLAVGQSIDEGTDERVVLFVQLVPGEVLSADLEKSIKTEVRSRRSPRHVPSKVRATKINALSITLANKQINIDHSGQDLPLFKHSSSAYHRLRPAQC